MNEQTKPSANEVSLILDGLLGGDRPKIICFCGSSRFIWYFATLAWSFEKEGYITLGLHLLPPNYTEEKVHADHIAEYEGVADKMDALHRRKIDIADMVFVINKDGYIGKSTAAEIEYATKLGKPIKYLEEATHDHI